uniref:4Fe-4S Wbl-type domain-containing protein n=1 Tax=Heterorhabditis bacteriophora TaxID=37862 RepID=A0A1I7XI88_HETBA
MATKCSLLREISTAYDPLGLISPAILQFRLFIQLLWKNKREWDDSLSEEEKKILRKIRQTPEESICECFSACLYEVT